MKKRFLILFTVLMVLSQPLVVSCQRTGAPPSPIPTPSLAPPPAQTPQAPIPTAPSKLTPTLAPTPTLTPAPSPTPAPLFLKILEPDDESIVDANIITIWGRTLTDAVVTVNEELVDVDSNGEFSLEVTLDEGPNVFDIVALDEDDNEVTVQLIVSFLP